MEAAEAAVDVAAETAALTCSDVVLPAELAESAALFAAEAAALAAADEASAAL